MCANALLVLWKADQLIRGIFDSMNRRDFVVASALARALMEVSGSFGVETSALERAWRERKGKPAPDAESLTEFGKTLTQALAQMMFGTKQ